MPGMIFLDCSIFTKGVPSLAFWNRVSSNKICVERQDTVEEGQDTVQGGTSLYQTVR